MPELNIKYVEAVNLYNNGCLEKAKKILLELLLKSPFKWEFWFSLATIYQLEKNYAEAILSYNRALILNSKNAQIYFHIAECMLSLNDKKNALHVLNMAKKNCFDVNLKDKISVLIKQNSSK
jgi:tetratricopeptide (TPR) repeat protein